MIVTETENDLWKRFERQALSTPRDRAVADLQRVMTYGELHTAIQRIRNDLRSAGVSAGQYVGVVAKRSVDTIAMMFAVMAEGAVYVPFDPEHPRRRIAACMEQLQIKALLTIDAGGRPRSTGPGADTELELELLQQNASCPTYDGQNPADQPAYVIFTSGSTGVPKVCAPTHANVLAFVDSMAQTYLGARPEVSLVLHSFAFDFSVWEMWMAFLTGGTVVITPSFLSEGLEVVSLLCESHHVTAMCCVPALLDVLLSLRLGEHARELRQVFVGGDRLHQQTAVRALETLPAATSLVHIYGVTEATVLSTTLTLTLATVWPEGASPVGRPLVGTELKVLDDEGVEIPEPNRIGELAIGGPTVIAGYVKGRTVDSERFTARPGAYYRTGDYGYVDADGNFYFVGRRDDQVQINGVRVECGDVQRAILALDGLADAIVLPVSKKNGRPAIGAIVVFDGDAASLRAALSERLVGAGIPTVLRIADRLPMNFTGKVDRAQVLALLEGRE